MLEMYPCIYYTIHAIIQLEYTHHFLNRTFISQYGMAKKGLKTKKKKEKKIVAHSQHIYNIQNHKYIQNITIHKPEFNSKVELICYPSPT